MQRIRYRVIVDNVGRLAMADPLKAATTIQGDLVSLFERLNAKDELDIEGMSDENRLTALDELLTLREVKVGTGRIMRRVQKFRARFPAPKLGPKAAAREISQIISMPKRGHVVALDAHEIDIAMADIHAEAPWMRDASTVAMRGLRTSGRFGARVPPMILTGPPGTGKTSWAAELARSLHVPVIRIAASSRGVFSLAGVESGWGNSQSGLVISEMMRTGCGNPVIVIDEIDKAPADISTDRSGRIPGIVDTILDMSEPSSSLEWTCPHLNVKFDLSRVSWVMTANRIDRVPGPLRDRFRVIPIERPTLTELVTVGYLRASERLGDEAAALIVDALVSADRLGLQPTLRTVERMIESAEGVLETPLLN